jgi:uncharacterized heparinase superfamily protein
MTDSVLGGPSRAWQRLKNLGFASPLYRLTLGHSAPAALAAALPDPWPGDPELGNAIFQGRFHFAGHEVTAPNQPPWRLRAEDPAWMRELHEFGWLGHFRAVGGAAASQHARRLVRSWIDLCGEWEPLLWEPDVLGRRLVAWTGHAGFLLQGADPHFQQQFLDNLARQWRHLGRAAGSARPGRQALAVAMGLLMGALALGGRAARTGRGLALLRREIAAQVLADGGHVSRAPSRQMAMLRDLVQLRDAFRAAAHAVPAALQDAIERMAPMLRACRHGDGGLALFNSGLAETAEAVEATLAQAEVPGRPLDEALASGFQRLACGRSVLIADVGPPAALPPASEAHAGALSFEFSSGRHRLVVNCGSGAGRGADWRSAMRVTAAHSTLTVEDTNNMEFVGAGRRPPKPSAVAAERNRDDEGNLWLDARHEGYRQGFGLAHRRRLFLGAEGADLRGEDRLEADDAGASERDFRIRFHLHPEVKASLVEAGAQALLRLPSGEGWRFRAAGADVSIEESVYLGWRETIRRTEQIVLSARTTGAGAAVKWAFRKV